MALLERTELLRIGERGTELTHTEQIRSVLVRDCTDKRSFVIEVYRTMPVECKHGLDCATEQLQHVI